MKKIILYFFLFFTPFLAMAQSSMSDSQVMKFIIKEHNAGTSQSQILTKLMQNGVDITQIRRVRKKYERQINQKGLGVVEDESMSKADDRMRTNNGEKKNDKKHFNDETKISKLPGSKHTYDEKDADFINMQKELIPLLPKDSIKLEKEIEHKKVFGRDFFNNKNLSFEPNMNIATPRNYRLGPGDAVIIDIYGASQKTINSTISPDGDVNIEDFGPVHVSGLTVAEANAKLRSSVGSRYRSSKVRLTVGQTKTIMVNIMGEVKAPGTYTLSAFATVFHALYMAGGPTELGTLRNIKVYRHNHLISVIDVYDYMLNGKLSGNIKLADNDVISVGTYDCLVDITGKVKRPMYYEMRKNESVATLLKYAGGFTGDAYTKAVRLVRKAGREFSIYNISEFDMSTFHVADGDSVSVDSILPRFSNRVEIKGAVFRPGMYQVGGDITSVRSLIEHAEGLTEDAFTKRAVMHRMRPDRTLEVIPVDVEGIMNEELADIPLKNNDVLFIPTKQSMMQQPTITIHGEVFYPGIYKYASNETIEDFILQAGGLKDAASTMRIDVARRVHDPAALTPDSVIAKTYTLSLKDGFVIDGKPGFTLMPFDEVYVRRSPGYIQQQNVFVEGQVLFSGTYTLSKKTERLSDIIHKAGGLTAQAYPTGARLERRATDAELLRMKDIIAKEKMQSDGGKDSIDIKKINLGETYYVGIELKKALENPGCDADLVLREGDKIIVPEYNGTVKISGDVQFPNTVVYEKGKSVSYYIDQAGGWGGRAKKSGTFIVYMNGTMARVGHNAKVMPGCEIIVPSKPKRDASSVNQWLSIGTSVATIATMIATLANVIK